MSDSLYEVHDIVEARVLERFKVWVRFVDGVAGTVDLGDLASRGVFQRWQEPGEFESMFIDPESKTLAWPGNLDVAPEPLYEQLAGAAIKG